MTKVEKLIVGAVGLALVAGIAWSASQRGAWKERVRDLEAQVAITDSLAEEYAADSVRWSAFYDSTNIRLARLSSDSARLEGELAQVEADQEVMESQLDSIRSLVAEDSLSQPVKDLLAAERRVSQGAQRKATLCLETLRIAQEQRSVCSATQDTLNTQIASLERLNAGLRAQRDSAMALLKPPPMFSLTFEVGVGPGCTVPISGQAVCGLSVQATILRFRLKP